MKRKTDLILSITIIILIVTGISLYKGYLRPFSTSPAWQYEQTVIKNDQDYNQNPDIIQLKDGCWRMYTHGWRKGVEENNIYSFYSCDGLNWEFNGLVIKEANMPAALLLDDGRIRLYSTLNAGEKNPLISMKSYISDDGLNFELEKEISFAGDEQEIKSIKTITHPEIIKLDRGYRIYFDEGELTPQNFQRYKDENWQWPVWRIRSLYSEDGLNWTLEPGIRIDYEQAPLTFMQRAGSCTVIEQGDGYQMYFSAGFSPWEDLKPTKRWEWSGVYLAASKDGLNFKIIDERILKCGDPKLIKTGNKIKMYCSASPWLARSRLGTKIYRQFFGKENNFIYTYTKLPTPKS